jgi:large subunit ribosomal protein L15
MMIHEITQLAGRNKRRKRVGRGTGSGGKRSGRGQKGAGSRSGTARKTGFEGGQMPYFRRLRKFGFSNANFTSRFWTVNIDTLVKAGLVRDDSRDLKILGDLGDMTLNARLDVTAARVSGKARRLIEAAGGKVNETGTRRDKVRGIDRNSDDQTPKNLTKKLKRSKGTRKPVAVEAEGDEPAKKDK